MRRIAIITAASSLALLAAACSAGRAQEGAGPTVSRNYQVGAFTGLEVAGPFDVTVSTGKPVSVTAQGPQGLLDRTEVVVRGGKLLVRLRESSWIGSMNWGSAPARFTIAVPSLTEAELAGSGDLTVDRVAGDRFAGTIAGSGDIRLPQVSVRELALSIAGSGGVEAAGQTQQANYRVAGSGNIDATRLQAVKTEAEVAGSGSLRATVTGEAKAVIAGSGDIEISGGARCQTRKAGSGQVRCS